MAAPTLVTDLDTLFNSTTTPKTTGSFSSLTVGEVLVSALVVENGLSSPNYTWSNSGTAETWTEATGQGSSTDCFVQIASTIVTTAQSATVSCARTAGSTAFYGQTTARFSGSDGIGNQAGNNTSQSVSITTTQANSGVMVVIGDWDATDWGTTRPWLTVNGQTTQELAYFRDSIHYTLGIAFFPDVGAAGAKTVGLSGLTGTFTISALEVKGSAGGGTNGSVTAVKATGSGAGISPALSAAATITAVAATALGTLLAPGVSTGSNANVSAVVATSTGAAVAPALSVGATITSVAAAATGTALIPAVSGETVLTGGGPATATAAMVAPAVSAGSTVTAVKAAATGTAIPPAVTTSGAGTVIATVATAMGQGVAPSLNASANITGVAATSTGSALAPVVGVGATVTAVRATATGTALAPTVTAGSASTVNPPAATATAAARIPTVSASAFVTVVRATGSVLMRVPTVLGAVGTPIPPIERTRIHPAVNRVHIVQYENRTHVVPLEEREQRA